MGQLPSQAELLEDISRLFSFIECLLDEPLTKDEAERGRTAGSSLRMVGLYAEEIERAYSHLKRGGSRDRLWSEMLEVGRKKYEKSQRDRAQRAREHVGVKGEVIDEYLSLCNEVREKFYSRD